MDIEMTIEERKDGDEVEIHPEDLDVKKKPSIFQQYIQNMT